VDVWRYFELPAKNQMTSALHVTWEACLGSRVMIGFWNPMLGESSEYLGPLFAISLRFLGSHARCSISIPNTDL